MVLLFNCILNGLVTGLYESIGTNRYLIQRDSKETCYTIQNYTYNNCCGTLTFAWLLTIHMQNYNVSLKMDTTIVIHRIQ